MNIFDRRREPQALELPLSKQEAAAQITLVNCSGSTRSSALCDYCGSAYEQDAQFCGQCGTRRERPGYTRLVSQLR